MVAGRQTDKGLRASILTYIQVGRQTETLGLVEAFVTSKPTPLTHLEQDHTFLSFLNSSTDWEPSMQIYGSVVAFLIQTTTRIKWDYVHEAAYTNILKASVNKPVNKYA